jgi:hypothetical protein
MQKVSLQSAVCVTSYGLWCIWLVGHHGRIVFCVFLCGGDGQAEEGDGWKKTDYD